MARKKSGYTQDLFDYVFNQPEPIEETKISDSIIKKKGCPQTVSQLTRKIRLLLEGAFDNVYIEGEISNFKPNPSGHYYFTLKDSHAQIPAVMFKNATWRVKFKIENGLKVIVRGKVQIYEPHGKYQFICNYIEPSGIGSLQMAFEQLKVKLAAEGLFDKNRKRSLPPFPKTIGVLTSAAGAAVHDIITVLTRRFPSCHLVLYPVPVQGKDAAPKIVKAIDDCNKINKNSANDLNFDVLIVGRGGGSLEDLWPFNEETLARAIVASEIPIISAVGHETDLSISDMVADFSAPTPSAAAELVIQPREYWLNLINSLVERMDYLIENKINRFRQIIERTKNHYAFKEPTRIIQLYHLQIDDLHNKISHQIDITKNKLERRFNLANSTLLSFNKLLSDRITKADENLQLRSKILDQLMQNSIRNYKFRIAATLDKLESIGPHAVVRRGFSITKKLGENKPLMSIKNVKIGDLIETDLVDGKLISTVAKK